MRIEVSLSPALYPFRTVKEHHATVAIDLLRATTAVCAAFQAGCSSVLPLDTLEGIGQFRRQGFLVAAERGGSKVGDAEYGNSPTEYLRNDMTGIKLAYSTTNGTVSILRAADADLTLVASFANLSALCDRLSRENMYVVLLCSGWQNDFCIEDTLYVHEGVRILGLGGSHRYRNGSHQYSERQMAWRIRRLWYTLRKSEGFDILVTHAPARGINDFDSQTHRGFACFLKLLDRWQPRYFLHGHIHKNYGVRIPQRTQHGATTIINACDHCVIEF